MVRSVGALAALAATVAMTGGAACVAAQEAGAAPKGVPFTITVEIDFEVEEIRIPGWEGGAFSEPVGAGEVELRLLFPPEGGRSVFQAGDARLTRYGCSGSAGCTCTPPPDLLQRRWNPVIVDSVEWDAQAGRITLSGPVTYPEDATVVAVRCPGAGAVKVEEHPMYKLLGAFGPDNERRRAGGFTLPLAGEGPWKKVFERELFALGPKVFRATLTFTVVQGHAADP